MTTVPAPQHAAALRDLLRRSGYDTAAARKRLGCDGLPAATEAQAALDRTREQNPLNALLRLFMLGQSLPREAAIGILGAEAIELLLALPAVHARDGRLYPLIVLVPVADHVFASDALSKHAGRRVCDAR